MTVLHINTEPTWRGGERQMCLLIEGLGEMGIRCITAIRKGSFLDRNRNLIASEVIPLPMRGELDLASAGRLAKTIDGEKVDIIHSHTSHAHTLGFFAKMLSKRRPIHLVTRRVDFDPYKKGSFKLGTFVKYRIMADHYIAISERIRYVLRKVGVSEDHISLVYSGVKRKRSSGRNLIGELGIKGFRWRIGNIAHLADHKHHENLLKAFSMLGRNDAALIIVGGGERMELLKRLSRRLGIYNRVIFTGFREDAEDFYSIFHLFVLSSKEEGLCSSLVDAFLNGVPVVATNAGGIPELVLGGETGLLVEKGNPKALATGINWALEHYGEMLKMAERAKKYALSRFTADAMVKGNYRVYRRLLGGR